MLKHFEVGNGGRKRTPTHASNATLHRLAAAKADSRKNEIQERYHEITSALAAPPQYASTYHENKSVKQEEVSPETEA